MALWFAAFVTPAGELPLEVQVERYLIELEMAVEADDHQVAVRIFEEKLFPLREKVEFPAELDYRYAVSLHKAGQLEKAEKVLNAYLSTPAFDRDNLQTVVKLQIAIEKERWNPPVLVDLPLGNGISLRMKRIPAGSFMMGSPAEGLEADIVRRIKEFWQQNSWGEYDETQHQVTITKPFYMGVHEVTQAQWQAVMGNNPSYFKGDDNPVEMVSWDDAVEFCRKLSSKSGRKVRLPTEAEWEYACRARTTTAFNTGETISTDQENYNGDYTYGNGRKGVYRGKTTPVGSFGANAWGLYDMHGNVFEWCSDWYGDYDLENIKDPQGVSSGTNRVVRGGSWNYIPWFCRSANRNSIVPGGRGSIGFRVVLD
jgi:formylglycine-generating enzyme required for sulfatase activity